jgi:hypothetical protein
LQIHLFSIFATATIILVWMTYSSKIIDRPLAPDANSLPRWMRLAFVPLQRVLASDTFNLNLQAAIVAVDMLALAALIKATEKAADMGEKVLMTLIVGVSVFSLTLGAAFLARHKMAASPASTGAPDEPTEISKTLARLWILVTLRLMEPLLIFYFLLQLLAHMSTGMHIDSPALLLAAALMVVAIVQRHSLAKILDAVRATEKAASCLPSRPICWIWSRATTSTSSRLDCGC